MDLDSYNHRARTTAVYPGRGTLQGLVYTSLGLAGEAGEFANRIKKLMRDDRISLDTPNTERILDVETEVALVHELGDVLWYVSQCADELGYDFEFVANANLKKLEKRYGTDSNTNEEAV